MTCDEFLDATTDPARKPSPEEKRALDEHAAGCPECAEFARDYPAVAEMGKLLEEAPEPPIPGLRGKVEFGAGVAVEVRASERAIARSRLLRVLALVSVLALLLAGAAFLLGRSQMNSAPRIEPREEPPDIGGTDDAQKTLDKARASQDISTAREALWLFQLREASAGNASLRRDAFLGEAESGRLLGSLTRAKAQAVLDDPQATDAEKAQAKDLLSHD